MARRLVQRVVTALAVYETDERNEQATASFVQEAQVSALSPETSRRTLRNASCAIAVFDHNGRFAGMKVYGDRPSPAMRRHMDEVFGFDTDTTQKAGA